MTNRQIQYWVIPPTADAEYVAHMEEVLETYAQPYNPDCPVICMDEQPIQLQKETRTPLPATAAHGKRVDYEYERAGTASIFMFAEPLACWREVSVRQHGSWLNIAENELSSLTRQCLSHRRFGEIETLRQETAAWSTDINTTQRGVDWQMRIDDARCKLTSLYPQIKS